MASRVLAVQVTSERKVVALERFARFFAEIRGAFLERDDIVTQLALALLAREHVLMTGPPGTGKSLLTSSLLGRIVCENTGEPSLFSKQLTESTVQTDLIGSVDFRTLTETGRTEYFTDEGMLGAVHAFLDEVLDGRDMLLRSTLNLLEERELKQGKKITRGQIECAVMTTNRYLSEALEEGRGTLLAFVDRIAFVSFVPRGFAKREHLEHIVASALAGSLQLTERLTIQDLDVLQAMVEDVYVPKAVSDALVDLARRFDAKAHELERADPTFARTRYLSTRAVIRLGQVLRAIVVFDRATARPERSLVATGEDLGALRLALMLAGPPLADLDALLERESEPRERHQLQIMMAEGRIFQEVLSDTPPVEVVETRPEAAVVGSGSAEGEPSSDVEEAPAQAASPELVEPFLAMLESAGDLAAIRTAHEASVTYERAHPGERLAAEAMRGHLLSSLAETLSFSREESVDAQLSRLEEAHALKERIVAMRATNVSLSEVEEEFGRALVNLGLRFEERFDERMASVMTELLGGPMEVPALLDGLRPLLLAFQQEEARYLGLAGDVEAPSLRVVQRRVVHLLRGAYHGMPTVDRNELRVTLEAVMSSLRSMDLATVVPVDEHLSWIATRIASDDVPVLEPFTPDLEGYRALRATERRTPISVSLVELLLVFAHYENPARTPGLSAMADTLSALPRDLVDKLAEVDRARIERVVTLLETWARSVSTSSSDASALIEVCLEEQALVRFCLECELLRVLFPRTSTAARELIVRLKAVSRALRSVQSAEQRALIEAQWSKLPGSELHGSK